MKRVALFVGVDRYEDGAFRDLRYSIADAAALAAAFGRYGYKTHVATNPGNRALLDEVERRTAGLGPGDVFVFFFAGHGYTGSGGEHLLICRDDRLLGLRHNRAGVPVDLLGDLTNGKGFHRAFLLDACRTDVFSGVEGRGAAGTRDLGLVAMPDAGKYPGTCCVVRSCDRFCPALEFEDLGHGVFTQAVLDFLSEPEGRAVRMGEAFAGGVRERMREILRREGSVAEQTPTFQSNGAAFALFGEEAVAGDGKRERGRGAMGKEREGKEGKNALREGAVRDRVSLAWGGWTLRVFAGPEVRFGRERPGPGGTDFTLRPGPGDRRDPYGRIRWLRISGLHCTFARCGGDVEVRDGVRSDSGLESASTNGTWWEGRRLRGPARLAAGEAGTVAFGGAAADGAVALRAECGDGWLLLRREDGVREAFLMLWGEFGLSRLDPAAGELRLCRRDGAFAWQAGSQGAWILPGESSDTPAGRLASF
ncbi:MAG: caspase family protein [Kiritimatiellae bacterium]|nr:caspase family protein [Kiritimatiellia bacterium]